MTQNPILTPGRHSQGPYTARASIVFDFQAHIWPQHRRRAQGLTRVPTSVRHLGGYTQRHLLFFSCTHLCPFFDPLLSKLYPLLSTYGQRKPSGNRPPRHRTAEHRIASERLRTLSELSGESACIFPCILRIHIYTHVRVANCLDMLLLPSRVGVCTRRVLCVCGGVAVCMRVFVFCMRHPLVLLSVVCHAFMRGLPAAVFSRREDSAAGKAVPLSLIHI